MSKWLQDGHHCWLAWSDNKVVGGLWIFFGHINLHTLSARVLSKNKNIVFDDNIGYRGYVIVNPNYRGKGIYTLFNDYVIKCYYKNKKIANILLITGASNGAVIKTVMNSYGKLIGIVQVSNICGFISRNEIFIDPKEKTWR
ncbi:MAG: GNAT family N-acetyltransferase [Tepidanaerobacteraceae bacterium]